MNRQTSGTPSRPGRFPPKRVSKKRVTRDDRPGETFTMAEAAARSENQRCVYQTVHKGHKCNGGYRWAPGSEPIRKPQHEPRPKKGPGRPPASKPVPAKAANAVTAEPLTPAELAVLVGALSLSTTVDVTGGGGSFSLGCRRAATGRRA